MPALLLVLVFALQANAAPDLNANAELARRCAPQTADEPLLYSGEFRWGYTLQDLIAKFGATYAGGKRLPKRMFWDEKSQALILPVIESWGARAKVPKNFVESVRRHVEEAVRLKYVDGIFFPDMGHSHLYVPEAKWKAITNRPVDRTNEIYEAFFNEPDLKILYHTAEQLQTLGPNERPLGDRPTLWRFLTRNLVGDNRARGHLEIASTVPGTLEYKANTVGDLPGYTRWGAGFNISASKDGCYAFKRGDEVMYFDLSLFDLEPERRGDITEP